MIGITKLGLALILIVSFSLLGFAAELLYVLCSRRRFHHRRRPSPGADPEDPVCFSKNLILDLLCCKKRRSQVEPASSAASPVATVEKTAAPVEEEEEECDLEKWRAMWLQPSRELYTIREEDEPEGEEETPFSTPCSSPPFYTPESSPPRSAEIIESTVADQC